jgi:hypothetical protein
MTTTARARLVTATAQAASAPIGGPPTMRSTPENIMARQPLIKRIQAVIDANALKIDGIYYLPGGFT